MCPIVTAQAPLPPAQTPQTVQSVADAGQTPAPQAAVTPPKPAPDPRELEFARREKQLRQSMQALKAEKDALTQSLPQKLSEYEKNFHQSLADDFWGTAIKAGLTPEQIIEKLTNKPSPENTQLTQLQLKLKQIEDQQKQLADQTKESETKSYEQAKGLIRKEVTMLVGQGDQYEAIKAMNSEEAVVELIDATLNQDGYMMNVEDAAKEVEDYLTDEILKFQKLKKIQSKLIPPTQATQPRTQPGKQPTPTLSNRAVQNATPPTRLTPAQRVERAKRIAAGLAVD